MRFNFSRDKLDFAVPVIISCSGWLVLLAYLYISYIRDSKNLALLLSTSSSPTRTLTIVILVAPLLSSILGYVIDERLKSYRAKYQLHFKGLFEDELRETLDRLILSFVNALDSKSPWTKGHSLRVQHYSLMIARELELPETQIEMLSVAALLHDIGKIGTYDDILNKTGALTIEEYEQIKLHPGNAVKILEPITQFNNFLPIIKGHHERVDGGGYPDGLKGKDIPLMARILCVADAFDAITSERPYKECMGLKQAVAQVQKCSGTQFDETVVKALVKIHLKPSFYLPAIL